MLPNDKLTKMFNGNIAFKIVYDMSKLISFWLFDVGIQIRER